MPHRRQPQSEAELRRRFDFGEGEHVGRVAPGFATACLGGFSLVVAVAAWTPMLSWLAWIALPLVFLLFLLSAWVSLTDLRATAQSLPGLLANAAAVAISAVQLFVSPSHPWVG